MLFNGSILNFIKLVELSFENDKISPSLGIKINNILLEFFEGINDLQEIFVLKEEWIVSLFDFRNDFFNREQKSILIKVFLERLVLEFLQFIEGFWLFSNNILN